MKKRLLSLLVASLLITTITGCGNNEEPEADEIVSEEAGTEETENEAADEEIATEYYYTVQVYGLDDALLRITSIDDAGEPVVEETGSYGWFGSPGGTLAEMMEEWKIESIEAVSNEFEFLGWTAYTMTPEDFEEIPLYDGKVFTTDEMMALELPDSDVYFYTEWKLICSGCEEEKLCDIHYIDNDRYIVCDDCYVEFATGMGLLSDGDHLGNTTYECGGCEVEKDCGIYWVGGQEYYVCDDCYEEFATGMGLL